ncbi:hypothetical protein [Paraburkholderia ferrariae]|uniref:hypothetical protein n=1 Tax=Paraburkholderia ferrariae TaxID=386056 RepID=UPI000486116D|nr:hypothetical protein [Paraburkholderia ferrariae]
MDVPTYGGIVEQFGLGYLASGADLHVVNGDLALTAHGDLQLGDSRFAAMHRFVQQWRFTVPTLHTLFVQGRAASERYANGAMDRDIVASFGLSDDVSIAAVHSMSDALGAEETNAQVFAGSIVVILNNMLQRLRVEVKAPSEAWANAGPVVKGQCVGPIVCAAAANFRHYDEWLRSRTPTPQQLVSMAALAHVLEVEKPELGRKHAFGRNVCPEVVAALSDDSFDVLGGRVFQYADALASWNR